MPETGSSTLAADRAPAVRRVAWLAAGLGLFAAALGLASVILLLAPGAVYDSLPNALVSPICGLATAAVGTLVARRRPRNAIGWIYLASALSQAGVEVAHQYAAHAYRGAPAWPLAGAAAVTGAVGWYPGLALAFTYGLLLFPDGRLPSPRWRPVALIAALPYLYVTGLAYGLWRARGPALVAGPGPGWSFRVLGPLDANALMVGALAVLCAAALLAAAGFLWRWSRSRGTQRRQMALIAYAAVMSGAAVVAMVTLPWPAAQFLVLLAAPIVPVAVGIAMVRYRLYDIDLIVRRTLIYAVVTLLLAATYGGAVLVLQELVRGLTGERSDLTVVASTLGIAALFTPLRRRVQRFVDRRFYRGRFDAEQALGSVAARLRHEVVTEALAGVVLGAIDGALRPGHLSLWLSEDEAGSQAPASGPNPETNSRRTLPRLDMRSSR